VRKGAFDHWLPHDRGDDLRLTAAIRAMREVEIKEALARVDGSLACS
jgi:hypothetical protein